MLKIPLAPELGRYEIINNMVECKGYIFYEKDDNVLEIKVKKSFVFRKAITTTLFLLPIYILFLYPLVKRFIECDNFTFHSFNILILMVMLVVTILYHLNYFVKNIHIKVEINKKNGTLIYSSLLYHLLNKEKIIKNIDIKSIILEGDSFRPNYVGGRGSIDITDPIGTFDNKVFIETANYKQLIYTSVFDKETDYYAWKISSLLGCSVFTENFADY